MPLPPSAQISRAASLEPDIDGSQPGAPGTRGPADVNSAGSGASATAGAAATAASHSAPIVVSVTGRVRHPGLVTLPAGSRVADAITAAGGVLPDVDLTGLNLAARLSDGASVVIAGPTGNALDGGDPIAGGSSNGASAAGSDGVININTADSLTLQELPGVGPVTAAAIIAYRDHHGPFAGTEQLRAVSGIGPATFSRLQPHITV